MRQVVSSVLRDDGAAQKGTLFESVYNHSFSVVFTILVYWARIYQFEWRQARVIAAKLRNDSAGVPQFELKFRS